MSLEDYEPVQSRFARFIEWCATANKTPQVISEMMSPPGAEVCVFKTTIILDGVIASTGWAEEIRDTSGKRSVNATSHVENCETSSLGRSMANFPFANFAGSDYAKRPTREEMAKVQRSAPTRPTQHANNDMANANGITVKGTQYGPLPDWLVLDAFNAGVTTVWDNRDKVPGTKRPWFKDVNGDKAFWPPKGTPDPIVATHEDDLSEPGEEEPF